MKHFLKISAFALSLLAGFPTVAASQANGQQAQMAIAGGLRDRPQTNAPVSIALPAGTPLQLQTRVTNSSGAWWYVSAAKRSGWVPENEVYSAQSAPVVNPNATNYAATAAVPAPALAPAPVQPAESASEKSYKPLAFVFELGAEFGGDPVATVFFTNGDSQDIDAGRGITAGLGFSWMPSPDTPVDIRTTVGYKYTTTAADNVDISMSRVMLAIVPTLRFDSGFWLAAGAERHLSTKFDSDGLGLDVDFDDATGFTLQAGYKNYAVRYLGIKYKGPFEGELDGSAVGLLMNFTLR